MVEQKSQLSIKALQKTNFETYFYWFCENPTSYLLLMFQVICYVASGILGILGVETLANVLNLVMGIALVLLICWAYVRYSGEQREMGTHIDTLADLIWENVSTVCMSVLTVVYLYLLQYKGFLLNDAPHCNAGNHGDRDFIIQLTHF